MDTSKIMPPKPLSKAQRMSYRIGRGETGVLTYEPYKSLLLPHWRFKTSSIAKKSSSELYAAFLAYHEANDFIGMDMARKFIQMGMTRAKRYANHKGGRKYDKSTGEELEKSKGHKGMEEKAEASAIFKEVWERCKAHEGYLKLKERFVQEQKSWDKELRREGKEPENACVRGGKEEKRRVKEEDVVEKEVQGKINEEEGVSIKEEE